MTENLTLNKAKLRARIATMSNEGIAANLLLHLEATETGGVLPNDVATLVRASRLHLHDWSRLQQSALAGFEFKNGAYHCSEIITQVSLARQLSAKRAAAAAKKHRKSGKSTALAEGA